ncbi:hypothetical protein JW933_01800 [candidate division FCPU426 bacterium]|nr:hypothetical protein [candidate division FCPU426 bacterium]
MGKKQRAKKEKQSLQLQGAVTPARRPSFSGSAWLIGTVVFLAVVVTAMVVFIQANKARFIKISVTATCAQLHKELYRLQAKFTRMETARLQDLLRAIEKMADADRKLDPRLGGHLMFVLKVMEEIIREGKLKSGELEKLEMLVHEAERQMSRPTITP